MLIHSSALWIILLVILVLMIVSAFWPHSRDWGPAPLGMMLVVLVILLLILFL